MVHVVDMEGTEETAHAVVKAAGRYDAAVNVQHGHAAFIQGTDDTGSDREQRDASSPSYSPNQPATIALCIRNQYAHTPPPTGFIVF